MACTYRAARRVVVVTMGGLNMGGERAELEGVGSHRWGRGEGEREREIYQQLVPALTRRRKLERYCISEAMIAPRLLALNCIRSLQEFSRHYDASSSSSSLLPFSQFEASFVIPSSPSLPSFSACHPLLGPISKRSR